MKLILVFLLTLSFSIQASSYKAKELLPFELESMIESLPWNIYSLKEKEMINGIVKELDSKLSRLNEKERYLFAKTTLIRYFLRNPPTESLSESIYNRAVLREIRNNFSKEKQTTFVNWLMRAILSDIEAIFNSAQYVNLQGKNPKSVPVLRKKFQLIGPWVQFFMGKSRKEIDFALSTKYIEAIKFLNSKIESYVNFKTMKKNFFEPSKKLAYFTIERETKVPEIENEILSIIDDVIKKHEKAGIPAPVEDWVPHDDDIAKKQKANIIKEADPDYVKPETLPEPVNDWLYEI